MVRFLIQNVTPNDLLTLLTNKFTMIIKFGGIAKPFEAPQIRWSITKNTVAEKVAVNELVTMKKWAFVLLENELN